MPEIGPACHRDSARICGPDCVAYQSKSQGDEYQEAWGNCVELTSQYRTAKHLVLLVKVNSELLEIRKKGVKRQQDEERKEKLGAT